VCNEFEDDEMDSLFRYGCSIYFIVITMRNWRSSVTAILGVHDVQSTTPPSSSVVLIQNDALYREHEEERGKNGH
jgi:hypothetical protein